MVATMRIACLVAYAVTMAVASQASTKECAVPEDKVSMMQHSSAIAKDRGVVAAPSVKDVHATQLEDTSVAEQLEAQSSSSDVSTEEQQNQEMTLGDPAAIAKGAVIAQTSSYSSWAVLQLLFGIIYYFAVTKFRATEFKPVKAEKHSNNAVAETFSDKTHISTVLMSFCCPGPQEANTLLSTGGCKDSCWDKCGNCAFFPLLLLTACFPCCTLCYVRRNAKVADAAEQGGCGLFRLCLCACFCWPCLVAQDAEGLVSDDTEGCGCAKKCGTFGNPCNCIVK